MPLPDSYPAAPWRPLVEKLPGEQPTIEVADPFRVLENPRDPQTIAWSAAQDELFAAHRDRWEGRAAHAERLTQLLSIGYVGPPIHRGQRVFRMRREGDQEHGVLTVTEPDAGPRVLLDPMRLDPSGATTLDAWQPSKEGDLIAYQVSAGGSEESVLYVLDVATGTLVDGPIDRARYSPVAWLPGADAFFYVRRLAPELVPDDERQYHRRVYLHRVATPTAEDVEVFGAGRPKTSYYGVSVSLDGGWLVVSAAQGTDPRNDVYLSRLGQDPAVVELHPVIEGADAQTGATVARDGMLHIRTDLDHPRGRYCVADPAEPGVEHWRELLRAGDDEVLDDVLVLDPPEGAGGERRLLVSRTRHAISELALHDAGGALLNRVTLPGLGSLGALVGRIEGGYRAWFSYTDPITPSRILTLDAADAAPEVTLEAAAPGEAEIPAAETRLVEYPSADGTVVRMFVTAGAGARLPAPAILYGYGGFGISMRPAFSPVAVRWVESGGVYATACLRGGGEEGEDWHRAGMLEHKQNVFDDFEAAATALFEGGWSAPDRLAVQGGSNGGLLVGAALTQWPERIAAVVCSAPLLDMVRYQLHGLGVSWTGEYGDADRPEDLRVLHDYSPYHRVRDGVAYPAVLFEVFDGDSRVDPLHARKMCAALQRATSRSPHGAPVLLRREADVGHGARAVSRSVALAADTVSFIAHHTGLET